MGRRALPKIPLNVDLAQHLLELKSMQPPLDVERTFADEAPLEIEVGCGKGLFLCSAATAHTERNFLGIEVAGRYARYVAAQLAMQRRPNAKIVHGDAELVFRDFLGSETTSTVHVYFPDPWWKQRHHKRRIMNGSFLQQVVRVLEPGGRLHFWTDVEAYYRSSTRLVADTTSLCGPLTVAERSATHDFDYRTHFERRTRLNQNPVFRAEFRKPAESANR